jgi:hypothetical protein
VTVKIGTVTCTTATVAAHSSSTTYTCVLPPGTYTLTFSAAGYTSKTVSGVTVTATATKTTENVTLT